MLSYCGIFTDKFSVPGRFAGTMQLFLKGAKSCLGGVFMTDLLVVQIFEHSVATNPRTYVN